MESNIDDLVHRMLNAYVDAVYKKDISAYIDLYDDDVVIFDAWLPWAYHGLSAWRKVTEEWFMSLGDDLVVVDVEDVQIHTDTNLAVLTATLNSLPNHPRVQLSGGCKIASHV